MPNINEFRPVIHAKKMFKVFCYIHVNLYKTLSTFNFYIGFHVYFIHELSFVTPETLFEQT